MPPRQGERVDKVPATPRAESTYGEFPSIDCHRERSERSDSQRLITLLLAALAVAPLGSISLILALVQRTKQARRVPDPIRGHDGPDVSRSLATIIEEQIQGPKNLPRACRPLKHVKSDWTTRVAPRGLCKHPSQVVQGTNCRARATRANLALKLCSGCGFDCIGNQARSRKKVVSRCIASQRCGSFRPDARTCVGPHP